jgi:hypothetical protein
VKLRGRNLEDDDVAAIVAVLDGWSGKLSWELLIEALEARKFARYTRQTLHKHARVAAAFAARKQALSGGGAEARADSPELGAALERIARLESENARVKAENRFLLEQFARWAYNAQTRGLDRQFLNRPLPDVHRDQTSRPMRNGGNNKGQSAEEVEG